ncbi:NADPH:quinone oxidoreductase family protein [Bordetella sp. BOR01]|uniref:NADPH:quinone oxidoreductase family protein n=1 Tax=Bordetella sp. BOR01 TaxID=2854779 RepID=UPI001C4639CC|nr:NADPH:quinone oxidoreductase family protein [Bordetella sp. BOR01]MBV7482362.1 NADPH:quinone oxidoreductase family protein [Bordetella sp. BOR01]
MAGSLMKAVVCDQYEPLEQLCVRDTRVPQLDEQSVRIQTRYASLNGPDLLMPLGLYQVKPELPFVLGLEAMGIVAECGASVTDLRPGDRVMAYVGQGCFAEQIVAPRHTLARVPAGMDDPGAAGFILVYSTAYHALVDCGQVQAGDKVLISGASGGIGIAAIQIAKAKGATVIAMAGTPEKMEACRAEGADVVLDSNVEDLTHAIRDVAGRQGVNVVLDIVGGEFTEQALRAIAPNGRHLITGYASGNVPLIKGNLVLLKRAQVIGVSYRQLLASTPAAAARNLEELCRMFEAGHLRPRTCAVYPLDRIGQALIHVRERRVVGKVAIAITPDAGS